ncbi:hypothetical protein HIM_01973 [Hirsutella minnesotensis 3608]|nr:hypothetical protein HIM_01973 [Hirsutella minnesotensis 3608]
MGTTQGGSLASPRQVCWKRSALPEQKTSTKPFYQARQFFAVDASGSTCGSIMRHQHRFVQEMSRQDDTATTWGSDCGEPTANFSKIAWEGNRGGTSPSCILKTPKAIDAIGASDVWYLLTDGEIWGDEVQVLCDLAMETGVLNVPVVFVITGPETSVPSQLNVSVGITFFANAPDVLVLFEAVGKKQVYILAGKGCFASLDPGNSAADESHTGPDLSTWDNLRTLNDEGEFLETCLKQDVRVSSAEDRPKLASGLINVGKWQDEDQDTVIDLDLLTAAGLIDFVDLEQLLSEDTFNTLCVACKTRGRTQDLRAMLLHQKIEEINVKLDDVSGAAAIVTQLSNQKLDNDQRTALQEQLRDAHAKNRIKYQQGLTDLQTSTQQQAARRRNRLVNSALEQLAEVESAGYTADILGRRSNRAKRAGTVQAGGEIPISSLDLDDPAAFRGECGICCGDDEVMSIAVRAGADGAANTDNFALDFPLTAGRFESNSNLISSQYACFQCALALEGISVYREELAAVIPALDYSGSNKNYIQEQLYLGLTGGLRTGASGVSQLFMAILDRTMKTRAWAGCEADLQDVETMNRRALLRWMLQNMLDKTGCRETFNEQGEWVTYRQAIAWAARDFRTQGIDSWIVGNPVAGFMQMVAFGEQLGSLDEQTILDLRQTKMLHSVVSAYLARLLKNRHADDDWKQPLPALVYADFRAPFVPIDRQGSESLVNTTEVFWPRLSAFLDGDSELLDSWDTESKERVMRRVQIVAFWLVYHQREHTRAKTFFQKLRNDQPLSHVVLDVAGAAISPVVTDPILLSIFRGSPTDQAFHARHTGLAPFVTPFGPSVLRCCFSACAEPFLDANTLPDPDQPWTERDLNAIRRGRAEHLVRVFAADTNFGGMTQTGLPVVTESPAPPASTHVNAHISMARAWSRMSVAERRLVAVGDSGALDGFIRAAIQEICDSRRGDLFYSGLEGFLGGLVPSFLDALKVALVVKGSDESDIALFEHNWEENSLESKAKNELQLARRT